MGRYFIALNDWQPGQFYIYGNTVYDRWRAGEVHWFRWQDVPHATANASHAARYTLQVSGVKTARTEEIIKSSQYCNFVI